MLNLILFKWLFNFLLHSLLGFDVLGFEDSSDYEVIQSANPDFNNAIIRVNIFRKYRQVIQVFDFLDYTS